MSLRHMRQVVLSYQTRGVVSEVLHRVNKKTEIYWLQHNNNTSDCCNRTMKQATCLFEEEILPVMLLHEFLPTLVQEFNF